MKGFGHVISLRGVVFFRSAGFVSCRDFALSINSISFYCLLFFPKDLENLKFEIKARLSGFLWLICLCLGILTLRYPKIQ